MPIQATELKKYGAASRPENDTTTSGGAVDAACVLDITQPAAADGLRVVSSAAGDTTQTVTVTGRNTAGAVIADTKTLNGTTAVNFAGTFERVLKVVLSAAAAGNVTVERQTAPNDDVVVIPAGKTAAAALFISSASEASITTRYEKEFWRNESAESLTLTAARMRLTADPSASIKIGVAAAKGDTVSVANRKTAPAGITFVDDGVYQDVPGTTLEANAAIGVWIEMTRAANAAPLKSTYTTELSGTTT